MGRYALFLILLLILVPMSNQGKVTLTFGEIFGGDITIHGVGIIRNETTFNISDAGIYNVSITLYCNNSNTNSYVKITISINNESSEALFERNPVKLSLRVLLAKSNSITVEIYKLSTGLFSILSNSTITLTKINQENTPANTSNHKSPLIEIVAILSLSVPIIIRMIQVKKKGGV